MNVQFALEYTKRRMQELGYGDAYILRWRFLQIDANATIKLEGNNEYYLLINPNIGIKVSSKTGVFDLTDTSINEMQYEHRGKIEVKNITGEKKFVLFIQVIPNHNKI
ncbi:MAG: hypothetical protein Q8L81_05720 [Bacteroidota bacterium]|nr:hypothetical protein [Bacteroidota bacterium]